MSQDNEIKFITEVPNNNRNPANKPVYIVSTECPENKTGVQIYLGKYIPNNYGTISVKGQEITIKQSEEVKNLLKTDSKVAVEKIQEIISQKDISVEVPWVKVIRIILIGYFDTTTKQSNKENK